MPESFIKVLYLHIPFSGAEKSLPETPTTTTKDSQAVRNKHKNQKPRSGSAVTATDIAIPEKLATCTERSPTTANGKPVLSSVRLPKLTSRPPAGHELDSVRAKHKRTSQEKREQRKSSQQRPKTPIERLKELGMHRLLTPELLESSEFNYIQPVYCHDVRPNYESHSEVENKGKWVKNNKRAKRTRRDGDEKARLPVDPENGLDESIQ